MRRIYSIFVLLSLLMIFSSCNFLNNEDSSDNTIPENNFEQKENTEIDIQNNLDEEEVSIVETMIKNMKLREKIGQIFMIEPEALWKNSLGEYNIEEEEYLKYTSTDFNQTMNKSLELYPVGGIVMFGKNIINPTQIKGFINELQDASKIPLFMGIDEEGGIVARIGNNKEFDVEKYDSMQAIGLTNDTRKAYDVGFTIGSYLKKYNFNLDFAPVADVYTNPENKVIGNRSFGSDPNLVADMMIAEVEGLKSAGVINCIKHFPGHGDTKGDTHQGFVSTEKSWDEILNCELIPFKKGIDAKVDMIMVSHITAPKITNDNLPSTLSFEMIEEKLRKDLNYEGVIITDSMEMGAIINQYNSKEAAILSILAGADIILMPENYIEAFDAIYDSVNNGTLSEERIDQSVRRILLLKEKYELIN